jgi:1,4-dihydroxy-2-naphthoate octaprenyltransferase
VLAFDAGRLHVASALAALAGAVLIQVGTNYANDCFDFRRGADTAERLGPVRATQAGLVTPAAMLRATVIAFGLAAIAGAYLITRGGWPIAVIGATSILWGVLYTAGPLPLAYLGLGEPFVLVYFGPVAVAGTYYVQALELSWRAVLLGLAPGFLSVAILTVNNLRDIEGDRRAGKRTLAVRLGRTAARVEYLLSLAAAASVPLILWAETGRFRAAYATILVLLAAVPTVRTVLTSTEGPALNRALAETGRLLFLFTGFFALFWLP